MGIVLLSNTIGDAATSVTIEQLGDGSFANRSEIEYDYTNMITGGRNSFARFLTTENDGTSTIKYNAIGGVTHVVIARADLIALSSTPLDLAFEDEDGVISDFAVSPLTSSNLIGIDPFKVGHGQDWVDKVSSARDVDEWIRIEFEKNNDADDNSQVQLSKLYFSNAFDFGLNPVINPAPQFQDLAEGEKFGRAIKGFEPVPVEKRITLTWEHLSKATVESFRAVPRIFEWPIFIYDEDAELFPWKLEHVIITGVRETHLNVDTITLEVDFMRLKHYQGAR